MSTSETVPAAAPWVYTGTLLRVLDGDTLYLRLSRKVEVDVGFSIKTSVETSTDVMLRLKDINAPELKSKNKKEVAAGLKAKVAIEALLAEGSLTVESFKPYGELDTDKFGRYLCRVTVHRPDGTFFDVASALLEQKVVVAYDGKGPRPPFLED